MTELLSETTAPSDAELISRVRGGDVAAYGDLFARHVDAATRLSRQLLRGPDADDLVSEAFAKVLQVLKGGGGPDVAFRAYLLTAVRRLHVDKIRSSAKLQTTGDMTPFDPGVPFTDTAVAGFESGAAAKAFASLPERWQLVLWHLEVEGQKPADIAPLLGMSANSVSALAYRAREGLRQAFLTMHLSDIADEECRWVTEHLGAYVRNGLSKRDSAKVRSHLDGCRSCMAMYLELTEVNSNLAALIGPLILGGAAAGYLAGAGTAGTGVLVGLFGRFKDTVAANTTGAIAAGAVAAGIAAIATTAFIMGQTHDDVPAADQQPGFTQSASPSPGSPSTGEPGSTPGSTSSTDATSPSATSSDDPGTTDETPGLVLPPPGTDLPLPPELTELPPPAGTDTPSTGPTDGPTDGPTGEPTGEPTGPPSPTPTETTSPKPESSDLNVGKPTIVDAGGDKSILVSLDGKPALPPSMVFGLTSSPRGIVFGNGESCRPLGDGGRKAVCSPVLSLPRIPLWSPVTRAAKADPDSQILLLPIRIPSDQEETELELTVSVPDGWEDPDLANNSQTFSYNPAAPPLTPAFVSMSPPDPASPVEDGSGTYTLSTRVSGVAVLPSVSYDLKGDASFADPLPTGCTGAGSTTLRCDDARNGVTDFVLAPDSPQGEDNFDVRISAELPDGYVDADLSDNRIDATLRPLKKADAAMGALEPAIGRPNGDDVYTLDADVSGVAGLPRATFRLNGDATFVNGLPDGCDKSGPTRLSCADPSNRSYRFHVTPDDVGTATPVTVTVGVPDSYRDTDPTNNESTLSVLTPVLDVDVALTTLALSDSTPHGDGAFTLQSTGTNLWQLDKVTYELGGATYVPGTLPDGCSVGITSSAMVCSAPQGDISFDVRASDPGAASDISLTAVLPKGFRDPDESDNTSRTTLPRASFDVGLTALSPEAPAPGPDGTYRVTTEVSDVTGLPSVAYRLTGTGASFAAPLPASCTASEQRMTCAGPADGEIELAIAYAGSDALGITVSAAVPDGYVDPDDSNNAGTATLTPPTAPPPGDADIVLGAASPSAPTPDSTTGPGRTTYTVSVPVSGITELPGVDFAVAGATFTGNLPDGCTTVTDRAITCDDPDDATFTFHLSYAGSDPGTATLLASPPAGWEEQAPDDNEQSVTLTPFLDADVAMGALTPPDPTPGPDGRFELSSVVTGVTGLPQVTYTLAGNGAFHGPLPDGCTPSTSYTVLVCDDPVDGAVTFVVEPTSPETMRTITITAEVPPAYADSDPSDNSASVTLPKTHFDVALSALDPSDPGPGTDGAFVVTSDVSGASGLPSLTYTLTGNARFTGPAACATGDARVLTCASPGNGPTTFTLTTSSASPEAVTITASVPAGYTDSRPGNNSTSATLQPVPPTPEVDAALSALAPAHPQPGADGLHHLGTTVSGVDSLAVIAYQLTGAATFEAPLPSGCTGAGTSYLTCSDPTNGHVGFALSAADATASTPVQITLVIPEGYLDTDPSNNTRSATLEPAPAPADDVVLSSLTRTSKVGRLSNVRGQVAGVPAGISKVLFHLSGPGTGQTGTRFTGGPSGATGQGVVDCVVSSATLVTCTHATPSFFADMLVIQPSGGASTVTITVEAVGAVESDTANNTRTVDVG